MTNQEHIEGNRGQVMNFIHENPNLVKVFMGQHLHETITNSRNGMSAARAIAKNHPELHLEKYGCDSPDEQAVLLIGLAEELHKPEYNQ